MNKLRGSTGVKVIAWFLIIVSSITFVGSAAAAVVMEEMNLYTETKRDVLENVYENIAEGYAYRAIDHIGEDGEDSNAEYFSGDSNYQYGIIKVGEARIDELNLDDKSIYTEQNFRGKVTDGEVFRTDFSVGDGTSFVYEDSIWNRSHYCVQDPAGDNISMVDELVYEAGTGIFYYNTEEGYYPAKRLEIPVFYQNAENKWQDLTLYLTYVEDTEDYRVEIAYSEAEVPEEQEPVQETPEAVESASALAEEDSAPQEQQYEYADDMETLIRDIVSGGHICLAALDSTPLGYGNWESIIVDDYEYEFPSEVDVRYFSKAEVSVITEYYELLGHDTISRRSEVAQDEEYTVISLLPEGELINEGNWTEGDLFVKGKILVETAYGMRYQVLIAAVLSLVLFLAALIFLVQAAGHRRGTEEIVMTAVDRIPLEIFLAAVFILEGLVIACMVETSYYIMDGPIFVMLFVAVGIAAELLAVETLLSCAVRIKNGKWWRNTLIVRVWKYIARACGKVVESIPLVWKAGLIYVGISLVEFFFICVTGSSVGGLLFVWFLEKILLAILLGKVVLDLKKLEDGGKHLAGGDVDFKVDTARMFGDFRGHGENLNNIGEGITRAVNERMKSERFKTELITNVSHDIKTPLTSIINYVDLLEKEELENANAKEYLEVLDRQSARLKKLIEDLMEASKASTGNLAVQMECCEAGVFMVQTIGEFGEKTEELGLDLIISEPEEPLYIMVDGRHFWRIIDNLMNNVCKYAQPQTRVYINLEAREDSVVITLRNTSKYPLNISSEELLERFVRGDSSRNTEGHGLGLNIAQNLTELMGGRFELVVDGDLFKVILTFRQVQPPKTE